MTLMQVGLDDKYRLDAKRIYLSGVQALVRLPMLQRERDRAADLNTAGFISGYRGSPLGMYDHALWRAKSFLQSQDIAFVPGLNEDLAATAVWGSQQVGLFPGAKVDGVFGIWYGKGPGVDRSVDALKHANSAGTSRHGGVLALAGDDHGCQSSTLAHQSEQVFAAALMPIINPSTLQDYLDLGLLWLCAVALFRLLGRLQGDRRDGRELGLDLLRSVAGARSSFPTDFEMPPGGLNIRWPDPPLEAEKRLFGPKMEAVKAFVARQPARPNRARRQAGAARHRRDRQGLSRSAAGARRSRHQRPRRRGAGPSHLQGRADLAAGGNAARSAFAEGLQDVLVVEEKRGFIEDQLMRILYNVDAWKRPSIVGKRDESGAPLLPSEGELNPTIVAAALVARLRRLGHQSPVLEQRLARLEAFDRPATGQARDLAAADAVLLLGLSAQHLDQIAGRQPRHGRDRLPWHGAVDPARAAPRPSPIWAPKARTGSDRRPSPTSSTSSRISATAPTPIPGLLALRAAAVSGVNITYKILYNDAVAMTGGQPAEGGFTVAQIAHQVWAEGTKRLAIVSDDPDKYPAQLFPGGRHRPSPPRSGRRAARAARDQGPHGADLRPDLRRRKAPPPQARALSRSAQARLHQRTGLRRLRRLLADLELRLGAAARHRVRPQAADRPVELQQGLFLRRGFLPELCDRAWRHAEAAEELGGRFRPAVRRPAAAGGTRARRALQHPRHRHRRHRRHHHRRAARHGRASRRQRLLRARLHRAVAEERRGHEPCPHRRQAGGYLDRPHHHWRRRSHPRLRHGGVGRRHRAQPRRPRRDQGFRQCRPAADRELRAEPRHRFRTGRDADHAARRHRRAQSRASSTPPASPRP